MCNLSQGIYNAGVVHGEDRLSAYIAKLLQEGKIEEALKVSTNKDYRKKVLAEEILKPVTDTV